MLSSSRLEAVACRFEPVVKDVRAFLKDNGIAYGFPEHLLSFTDHLTEDEALREAVAAKLHTVVSRVPDSTSHGDLVELLLLSVGGFDIDEDTPPMQKAERTLSRLLGEVMTSPQTLSPGPPPLAPLPPPPAPLIAPPLALPQAKFAPQEAPPEPMVLQQTQPEPTLLWEDQPEATQVQEQPPVLVDPPRPLTPPVGVTPTAFVDRSPDAFPPAFATASLPRLRPQPVASPAFTWTPAPRFVWAALVCGLLFPPGMYLISQPHVGKSSPPPPRAETVRPGMASHAEPTRQQPAQPTDLDRQTDEDLASIAALGFGTNASKSQVALAHFRKLRTRQNRAAHTTSAAQTAASTQTTQADLGPHRTDVAGRDLGSLAPAISASQPPRL